MEGIGKLAVVNHSIPIEERAKVYCVCVRTEFLYAAETWALMERLEGLLAGCDHRITGLLVKSSDKDVGCRTLNID